MNFNRWNHTHPIPYETRLAKLVEEVGEVASALLKFQRAKSAKNPAKAGVNERRAHLIEELEHVEFQAAQLRMAISLDEWREKNA